jgi:hypothetical protein
MTAVRAAADAGALFNTLTVTTDRDGAVRIHGHLTGSVTHLVAQLDATTARDLALRMAADVALPRRAARLARRDGLATVTSLLPRLNRNGGAQ